VSVFAICIVSSFVFVFLRLRARGNIFVGALVNVWIAWLCFSALGSSPLSYTQSITVLNKTTNVTVPCNKAAGQGWLTFVQILGHLFWTYITMFSLSTTTDGKIKRDEEGQVVEVVETTDQQAG
jgi:hypothetical protein